MKILIINSDSPRNRGDRAILMGGIKLVRLRFPDAQIWAISDEPERDSAWFGIRFLRMGVFTTNPLQLLRLGWFARTCDLVLWGGGELLKDYTNKLGLLYWVVKVLIVRIFNPNLYGFFQGIGPTKSSLGRWLIARIADCTRQFLVRDEESARKLRAWGARVPIRASYDPAILCDAADVGEKELSVLKEEFDITREFLAGAVGVGARRWFHYRHGGWIPFRVWEALGLRRQDLDARMQLFGSQLAQTLDALIASNNCNIAFFPMHTSRSEDDIGFADEIRQRMVHGHRVRVIDKDVMSPQHFHNAIRLCRAFLAFRLHSFILATTAGVPAMIFYYVEKGKAYADQIGMRAYSWPIEEWLRPNAVAQLGGAFQELLTKAESASGETAGHLEVMRQDLIKAFEGVEPTRGSAERAGGAS